MSMWVTNVDKNYLFALFYIFIFSFQFKKLLLESPQASHYLQGELTIFAPSDRAMRKYTGPKDENFILNHMGE